jgi:hypothetical protein
LAVHPAEAEGLLDRLVVADPRLSGTLLVIHEPDLPTIGMMPAEPGSPLGSRSYLECFAYVHMLIGDL